MVEVGEVPPKVQSMDKWMGAECLNHFVVPTFSSIFTFKPPKKSASLFDAIWNNLFVEQI